MTLRDHLRYALRSLRRTPLFTIVVVATVAIATGANAAMFAVLDRALLRTLPVPHPEELVNLSQPGPRSGRTSTGSAGPVDAVFSYPLFRDLERIQNAFTAVAAQRQFSAHLAAGGVATSEDALLVSGGYFPALGLKAAAGRLLDAGDDQHRDGDFVAVLADSFWESRFNRDPAVIGRGLTVNGQTMTIVGVAPVGFSGTAVEEQPRVFVPLSMAESMLPGWKGLTDRRDHWLYAFGRLRPGITAATAMARLNVPFAAIVNDLELPANKNRMSEADLKAFKGKRLIVEAAPRGQYQRRDELAGILTLLLSMTGVLLILACANVANLLLARAASRAADTAVRLAIGARRRTVIGHLLVEAGILSLGGTLAGLFVGWALLAALATIVPSETASLFRLDVDAPLLAFALALGVFSALASVAYPALQLPRLALASMNHGAATRGGQGSIFRASLAAIQVALSMSLLVVAALFARSVVNLTRVDVGFPLDHLATFSVSPALSGYTPARSAALFDRIQRAIAELPGVTRVSTSTTALLSGNRSGSNVTVEGAAAGQDRRSVDRNGIGEDFFKTTGMRLVAGREFTLADAGPDAKPSVFVVNEAFVRRFSLGSRAVGRHMKTGSGGAAPTAAIVGVVQDAHVAQLKDAALPQFFTPRREDTSIDSLHFYVRTSVPEATVLPAIRAAVARQDPTLPVDGLAPMSEQAWGTASMDRLVAVLAAGFALLAALLAALGLYGVVSYGVMHRTREFGVRMALGAGPRRIQRLVFGYVGWLTAVGTVAGLAGALALGALSRELLFGVTGTDPIAMVMATLLVAAIAFAAAAVPAQRAARIEPTTALRGE